MEMLIALLITSMAGMVALGGLVVAANSYRDILMKSQAQMIMKEYMDSVRSILISVSPDSGFDIVQEKDINGNVTRIYLPNQKANCAGYFTTKSIGQNGNEITDQNGNIEYSIIVFQHINPQPLTNGDHIYADVYDANGNREQTELVTRRMAKAFFAEMVDFSYNSDGAFTGTIRLTSNAPLSSGQPLTLEETFAIHPLNYHK